MIITIDGPAASGKGMLTRNLASALGYASLDTGMLYRAVGFLAQEKDIRLDDEASLAYLCHTLTIEQVYALDDGRLRGDSAANAASQVAVFKQVRQALLSLQQDFAQKPPFGKPGAILDGRDTGTVVCPGADRKFFLTASLDVRAKRRTEQLQGRGESVKYNDILVEMAHRDSRDAARVESPLAPPLGCFYLDTTALDDVAVLKFALEYIETGCVPCERMAPIVSLG